MDLANCGCVQAVFQKRPAICRCCAVFKAEPNRSRQVSKERGSDEIRTDVNSIIQLGSGTKTYSGLQFVNDNVYPNMRRQSFKILITMTDGKVKEARNANTINQARSFYNMMVAVGVGSVINRSEILDFSSTDRVFNVTNFAALKGIISDLVGDICFRLGRIMAGEFLC